MTKDPADKIKGPSQIWQLRASGHWKLNWDAAINSEGPIGLGAVVKNNKGEIMIASAKGEIALDNVALAEALAIQEGIMIAKSVGLWPLKIEADTLTIVNLLRRKFCFDTEIGLIVQHIRILFPEIDKNISHISRLGNCTGHCLAKWASSSDCLLVWVEEVPTWLESVVYNDMCIL